MKSDRENEEEEEDTDRKPRDYYQTIHIRTHREKVKQRKLEQGIQGCNSRMQKYCSLYVAFHC